jgi:GlpG protein
MRLAGSIPDENDARRFFAYLLTLGITSKVEPSEDGFSVWIREEEHIEQAMRELQEFLRQPSDPRYAKALETARRILHNEEAKDKAARKNYVNLSRRWDRASSGPKPVTVLLIVASLAVAILSRLGEDRDSAAIQYLSIATYQRQGNQIAWFGLADVTGGEVWRLVTPILIHFGPLHLIFNMWMLFDIGRIVEARRGSLWMAFAVLFIAVPSNLAEYARSGPGFGGMSGVLYGLFGYLWMKHRYDPSAGIALDPRFIVIMVAWFFICWFGWVGPIANMAHSAGMLMGIVIGLAPVLWRKIRGG